MSKFITPNTKQSKHSLSSSKLIIFVVVMALLLASCLVMLKLRSQTNNQLAPLTYEQAVSTGAEPVVDEQILSVILQIDSSTQPEVSVLDIKSYSNGSPRNKVESGDYMFAVINSDGTQVYKDYFDAPEEEIVEKVNPETGKLERARSGNASVVPLTLPWFGSESKLVIKDNKGKVVLQRSLNDVPKVENTPDYEIYQ